MIALADSVISIIVTFILTFGLLWMFYPAWAVLIAGRLEWEIEQLSSSDTLRSQLPVLSLVIPAYNEQDRIPLMIRESFNFLASPRGKNLLRRLQSCAKSKTVACADYEPPKGVQRNEHSESKGIDPTVEWLIVNDGSSDSTSDMIRNAYNTLMDSVSNSDADDDNTSPFSSVLGWKWQIVSLKKNSGKGAAVKTGMNLANGMFHLMVDADGATDFEKGLENLAQELEIRMELHSDSVESNDDKTNNDTEQMITVFGSRAHLEKESKAKRSLVRTLLMKAFHFFVSLFVSNKVHDTQCGFKMFTKLASRSVFENLKLRRWAFDTEIVLLCDNQGIEILEVAVPWKEVDGSKLSTSKIALASVSICMLRDMICVRACYTLGIWMVKPVYQFRDSN